MNGEWIDDRLVEHIRRKLEENGEILDHFDVPKDNQIRYIMLATIEIVNEECRQCFYCKNYRRFSLGSPCKIRSAARDSCFHFTLDVSKVLKKKYYHILIKTSECTRGQHIVGDINLSRKTVKNIIYESIRLSESIRDFDLLNSDWNNSGVY